MSIVNEEILQLADGSLISLGAYLNALFTAINTHTHTYNPTLTSASVATSAGSVLVSEPYSGAHQ